MKKYMHKLPREFYFGDTEKIAKNLLGKILVHETEEGVMAGKIVETEAYLGIKDPASHAYGGRRTPRTETMYSEGGHAYVYLIYGMYDCMNVVTGERGNPEAVLIRALEPMEGVSLMEKRRKTEKRAALCSGPGKLCMAMGITRENDSGDLCANRLYIAYDSGNAGKEDDADAVEKTTGEKPESGTIEIISDGRIGIDYAGEAKDWPLRFMIKGSPYISVKPKSSARTVKNIPEL